jgi:hypothetical protein
MNAVESPTRRLLPQFAGLHEGLGSAYERYAVGRLTERLVRRIGARTVAEWPANGVLGVPGLKSIPLALAGCDVTLVNPSRELLDGTCQVWRAAGLAAPRCLALDPESDALAPNGEFDLVWSFCAFEHARDTDALARAMVKAARGFVLVFVQNAWMPGVHLHSLQHRLDGRPWDHGAVSAMRAGFVAKRLRSQGAEIVEIGGCDLPPWPDINVKLPRRAQPELEFRAGPRPYGPSDPVLTASGAAQVFAGEKKLPKRIALLALWHDRVERALPRWILRFLAHHPYVLARKSP